MDTVEIINQNLKEKLSLQNMWKSLTRVTFIVATKPPEEGAIIPSLSFQHSLKMSMSWAESGWSIKRWTRK